MPVKKEIECAACGKIVVKVRADYKYAESGLGNVVLSGINVYKCSCGKIVPEISNVERLHWFIALTLLKKPNLLTGEEFSFLRKQVMQKKSVIAFFLDVSASVVSRWERSNARVGVSADRDIRMLYIWVIEIKYQRVVDEILDMEALKMCKKDLKKLENSDFKKVHDAAVPGFELLKSRLKLLKYRAAKTWPYSFYFAKGRGGSWRAQIR